MSSPERSPSSPPLPRRKNAPRLPPDERRTQFLDAALQIVVQDGLAGLSMEGVARNAGVAKPVLYALYPSRSGLVSALLEREYQLGFEELVKTLPRDLIGRDPDDAWTETVRAFLEATARNPMRWQLILRSGEDAPAELREEIAIARRGILEHVITLGTAGMALRGGPMDMDPELFGHAMYGVAEMLGRLHLSDPTRFDRARLNEFARALALALPRSPRRTA